MNAVETGLEAAREAAAGAPFFLPVGNEIAVFEQCHAHRLAVMLKGPTGCGKTRFVEYMAWKLGRPLITIACHDDLSATDLLGRYLIRGNETVWQDGPLSKAVRTGAICYLDEVMEARQDTVVVIHSLTDHRRLLPLDKTGELIAAAEGFQLVVSFNPGYQHAFKDLKQSTRQRFVALDFDFPPAPLEAKIVAHESGLDMASVLTLIDVAQRMRAMHDEGLAEVPSTRLLVAAARLMVGGIPPRQACYLALVAPLSDDATLIAAMRDLVDAIFID